MKTFYSIVIIFSAIFLCSCDSYWESQYDKRYLPEELVFQYDSGEVFVYEHENGSFDSLIVCSEEQLLTETGTWEMDEHQEYKLVNLKESKNLGEYNNCIDNCRGTGEEGFFYRCAMNCNTDFENMILFEFRSITDSYWGTEAEPIYSYINFNNLWWHDIDNIPGYTYTIKGVNYSNSKIFKLKNNENFYLSIDSVVFNYKYGVIAYRDIETGWYKLKTIEELD